MGLTTKSRMPTFQGPAKVIVPTPTFSGLATENAADSINPYTLVGPGEGGAGQTYDEIYGTTPIPNDPNYNDVSLLLQFSETNGSTTTVDGSSNAHSLTANGTFNVTSTNAKYGNSGDFDGGGWLTVPDDASLQLGSGDFTIEGWFYPRSTGTQRVITKDNIAENLYSSYLLYINSGRWRFYASANGTSWGVVSNAVIGGAIVANEWIHIAIAREGTQFRMFSNGVLVNTVASAAALWDGVGSPVQIGQYIGGTQRTNALMDDVRITKGVARYTANFTPPAQID